MPPLIFMRLWISFFLSFANSLMWQQCRVDKKEKTKWCNLFDKGIWEAQTKGTNAWGLGKVTFSGNRYDTLFFLSGMVNGPLGYDLASLAASFSQRLILTVIRQKNWSSKKNLSSRRRGEEICFTFYLYCFSESSYYTTSVHMFRYVWFFPQLREVVKSYRYILFEIIVVDHI